MNKLINEMNIHIRKEHNLNWGGIFSFHDPLSYHCLNIIEGNVVMKNG